MKPVNEIALNHNINPEHLTEFAGFEMSRKNFHVQESNGKLTIPHFYIDLFLKSYKEHTYQMFITYVRELGYTPLRGRIIDDGFELIIDNDETPMVEDFTQVIEQKVRLSFKDMLNTDIVTPTAFKFNRTGVSTGYS